MAHHRHHLVLRTAQLRAAVSASFGLKNLELELLAGAQLLGQDEPGMVLAKGDGVRCDQDLRGCPVPVPVDPWSRAVVGRGGLRLKFEELRHVLDGTNVGDRHVHELVA